MRDGVDDAAHERFATRVIRTLAAVERTNTILHSARARVTLSARWPSGARHTRRNAVASVVSVGPTPLAHLVDQAPDTARRPQLRHAVVPLRADALPAAPCPSHLQQEIAGLVARAAALAERISDEALRDRLAIADAAVRDTRHWLLDEPRHTPEALLDIQASVRAVVKLLDEIEVQANVDIRR